MLVLSQIAASVFSQNSCQDEDHDKGRGVEEHRGQSHSASLSELACCAAGSDFAERFGAVEHIATQ